MNKLDKLYLSAFHGATTHIIKRDGRVMNNETEKTDHDK